MAWFDQDYVIRLIQQSQDKKGLLTHDHRSHRRGEEEHKINNKKVNVLVCVVQTENKEYKEERKNTQRFIEVHPMWASPLLTIL